MAGRRSVARAEPGRGGGRPLPLRLGCPDPHLPARQHHRLRGQPARAPHAKRRPELGGHQPGPVPQRPQPHGLLRRPHRRQHRRRVRGRGVRHRRVAHRAGTDLGGHQRRPPARHPRQRGQLDQRDRQHARPARVAGRAQHRRLPLRRGHGVRGHRRAPDERPRSVHLPDARLRRVVREDHGRHSAQHAELHEDHHRGHEAAGPALRRHRERHLRVLRRRRQLAAAPAEPARRPGLGRRHPGALQRPGRGHLRARLLDPRRSRAAAATDPRGDGVRFAPVRAPRRVPLPAHHAPVGSLRRSHRRDGSRVRRLPQLLAVGARRRDPHGRDRGRHGRRGAHPGRQQQRGREPHLLGSPRRAQRPHPPVHEADVRRAHRGGRGGTARARRVPDLHPDGPRPVHRAPQRGRGDARAAAHRHQGSAFSRKRGRHRGADRLPQGCARRRRDRGRGRASRGGAPGPARDHGPIRGG